MSGFIKNWKTSLVGLVGAILVGWAATPGLEGGSAGDWAKGLGAAVVVALGGLFAADAQK
jgi:hypothetical protein